MMCLWIGDLRKMRGVVFKIIRWWVVVVFILIVTGVSADFKDYNGWRAVRVSVSSDSLLSVTCSYLGITVVNNYDHALTVWMGINNVSGAIELESGDSVTFPHVGKTSIVSGAFKGGAVRVRVECHCPNEGPTNRSWNKTKCGGDER